MASISNACEVPRLPGGNETDSALSPRKNSSLMYGKANVVNQGIRTDNVIIVGPKERIFPRFIDISSVVYMSI